MRHFTKVLELKKYLKKKPNGTSVGFVPTMGALHQGHLSLINRSLQENNLTIVSIFVNPTQFDNKEDLVNYPSNLKKDIKLLESIHCDICFSPKAEDIYNKNIQAKKYSFEGLENVMEGKYRTGHFDGVATIVTKLFEIVQPNNAYFGEKDFQQLAIIRKTVQIEKLPISIIGCPIFREKDGLAMSSRNQRLTKEHRDAAPLISQTLLKVKQLFETKTIKEIELTVKNIFEKENLLELEYFTIADEEYLKTAESKLKSTSYRAFIAVFAGDIRLIDNIHLA